MQKTWKKEISTNIWSAQYPKVGPHIHFPLTFISLCLIFSFFLPVVFILVSFTSIFLTYYFSFCYFSLPLSVSLSIFLLFCSLFLFSLTSCRTSSFLSSSFLSFSFLSLPKSKIVVDDTHSVHCNILHLTTVMSKHPGTVIQRFPMFIKKFHMQDRSER